VRRFWLAMICALALASGAAAQAGDPVRYLRAQGQAPADYILSKLRDHRVVLLGEGHWVRHDVQLVAGLVPRLQESGADALAMEVFPARAQGAIDRLVTAGSWDATAALGVLRTAAWPYREYLEILHAVWAFNRGLPPGATRLKVIALGPGEDWRATLLPQGQTYDTFMARLVLAHLRPSGGRILAYTGGRHAFTRYYQGELPRAERVEHFMDRMGNILWRELGEDVFLISLHTPWQCRAGRDWSHCLPLGGAVDCAAAALGRPVAFDVAASPFAELRITAEFSYGLGYPDLRLEDVTDGYVWSRPVEGYQGVELIPLTELAPDAESLAEVAQSNPFSDQKTLDRTGLEALWKTEAARLRDLPLSSGWQSLAGWREQCKAQPRSSHRKRWSFDGKDGVE